MIRVCPLCKSSLTRSSVYFCEYCGGVLPENLQLEKPQVRTLTDIYVNEKKSQQKRPRKSIAVPTVSNTTKGIISGILLGISLSVTFFVLMSPRKPTFLQAPNVIDGNKKVNYETTSSTTEPKLEDSGDYLELGLNIKSGDFGKNEIFSYIPYDSKLFIEFSDSSSLISYFGFLGGEFFTLLENIGTDIGPSYSAFYLDKGVKKGWVVVTFPLSDSVSIKSSQEIFADKVDRALVISQFPELIDEVRLARSGVSKSYEVHPVLISIKPLIPVSGQILIFKNGVGGDSVVEDLIRETLSEELKSVMIEFRDIGNTYLVIK